MTTIVMTVLISLGFFMGGSILLYLDVRARNLWIDPNKGGPGGITTQTGSSPLS